MTTLNFLKPLTQFNSIFNSFVEISFNILLDHAFLLTTYFIQHIQMVFSLKVQIK